MKCVSWTLVLMVMSTLTTASILGQRINTVQLDGTQYYISAMNPYSAKYNFHLAYQYCRSVGLQLLALETREKTETLSAYLRSEGYGSNDFWTSGNTMGSNMWIWMSTGLAFNNSINYWNSNTPQRERFNCLATTNQRGPRWSAEDCNQEKEFICEQPRCFYYNYGTIVPAGSSSASASAASPVSQGTPSNSISRLPPTRSPVAATAAKPTVIRRRITLRPTQLVLPTSVRNSQRSPHPAIPSTSPPPSTFAPSSAPSSAQPHQNELLPDSSPSSAAITTATATEMDSEEVTTTTLQPEDGSQTDDLTGEATSYDAFRSRSNSINEGGHIALVVASSSPRAQGLLRPYGFERKEPVSWLHSRQRKG